jgi:hypothetical protein
MLNYYQPHLLPFLKFRSNPLPDGVACLYYHSFEDGLWDLIRNFYPGKKLHFLVPDFYCSDVLDNIRSRGHKYTYYPLDENFQISSSQFKKYLWLFKPDIVVIFHACGITSGLAGDTSWLSDLPETSLVLEDSVHLLVDPSKLKFWGDRHFVMDSLRKVSPLPGSRIFGRKKVLELGGAKNSFVSGYFLSSVFFYLAFRTVLGIGFLLNSSRIVAYSHECILRKHDDIIGDNLIPQGGLGFFRFLFNRFDYRKVGKIKQIQVEAYQQVLAPLFNSPGFYRIDIPVSDYSALHVYPVGVMGKPDEKLIKFFHSRGLPVWFKFTDTPWSQSRGVLFFPLGFHVSVKAINNLIKIFYDNSNPSSSFLFPSI